YHLPPTAHATFVGRDFVVATFCPRRAEEDPEAMRLPYFHRNVDFDELVFYHRGEFFSRGGLGEGCMTYHPHGLFHGPQPGAFERNERRGPGGWHNEIAVNIDARNPLTLTPAADAAEVPGYDRSWARPTEVAAGSPG
ncbi:MAG: homogentisate 1,2-dioxygenase, partial [Actinobacteria bacterium]|nr:homogentisate 1,2-dioxygenase [Actinomycetota bacterium]